MNISSIILITILMVVIIITIVASIISNKKDSEIASKYFKKENLIFYESEIKKFIGENTYNSGYKFEELYKKLSNNPIKTDALYSIRIFEEANILASEIYKQFESEKYSEAEKEIKEYIAISLMMPYHEILKYINEFDFFNNPKTKRIRFVENLADEYRLSVESAAVRIKSILVIENIAAE